MKFIDRHPAVVTTNQSRNIHVHSILCFVQVQFQSISRNKQVKFVLIDRPLSAGLGYYKTKCNNVMQTKSASLSNLMPGGKYEHKINSLR